jgi:hypothetical protein
MSSNNIDFINDSFQLVGLKATIHFSLKLL